MEVHGTVFYESQRPPEVPAFVKNHGLLPQPEFQQLLRKAKVSRPPTGLPEWTGRAGSCSHVCTHVVGRRVPLCSEQPGQPRVAAPSIQSSVRRLRESARARSWQESVWGSCLRGEWSRPCEGS